MCLTVHVHALMLTLTQLHDFFLHKYVIFSDSRLIFNFFFKKETNLHEKLLLLDCLYLS